MRLALVLLASCACSPLPSSTALPCSPAAPAHPIPAELERLTLEVVYWEGSFGTYLNVGPGGRVNLDLTRIGQDDLLSVLSVPSAGTSFDLSGLRLVHDEVQLSERGGWTRQLLLKQDWPERGENRLMEVLLQYEVAAWKEHEGRRIQTQGNVTHATLRLHTQRSDGTLRECALARAFNKRDFDFWVPTQEE